MSSGITRKRPVLVMKGVTPQSARQIPKCCHLERSLARVPRRREFLCRSLSSLDSQKNGLLFPGAFALPSHAHSSTPTSVGSSVHNMPLVPLTRTTEEMCKGFDVGRVKPIGSHAVQPAVYRTTFWDMCLSRDSLHRDVSHTTADPASVSGMACCAEIPVWLPEAIGTLLLGPWHVVCSLSRGCVTLVLRCLGFPVPPTSRLCVAVQQKHTFEGDMDARGVYIDKMHDINDRHSGAWLPSCGFGACLAMARRTSGSCA